jgi:hypothetical protein
MRGVWNKAVKTPNIEKSSLVKLRDALRQRLAAKAGA